MHLTLNTTARLTGRYTIRIMAFACLCMVFVAYGSGYPEVGAALICGGIMGYLVKTEEVQSEQP